MNSTWVKHAISEINADYQRSADTHLIRLPLPGFPRIQLYLKDESTHPTGSLKHRLARSLFLYGLCNGWIKEGTTIIESSSGSTAVSEAYFARLLGLPFIAVMPACTAKRKVEQIEFYGGRCHFVESACEIYAASEMLARELNGHYMDQFTFAERATDWRGNNNIADSIFRQMTHEPHPVPAYIVMSAGTGGTSATIGRYIRCQGYDTQLMVVDPQNSVFLDYWQSRDAACAAQWVARSKGLAVRASNPHSFRTLWMRCSACRTPPASRRRTGWRHSLAVKSGLRPAPICGARYSWPRGCVTKAVPDLSSRCCATAGSAIWTPITTQIGYRPILAMLNRGKRRFRSW